MTSQVSQTRSPAQGFDGSHENVSPRPPTPSSANVPVSGVAKKVLLDPQIRPSDGSCLLMSIANGDNQPFYERLVFYLLGRERSRLALTCGAFLQKALEPLLVSFGITYPYAEENKEQTLERITTILNPLKESTILTENEKNHFSVFSAEEIIQNPKLLYLLLNTANRYNLVIMILKNVRFLDFTKKSFPQKVTAVLKYLQQKRKTIEKLEYKSLRLTNIPEEICDLKDLVDLNVHNNHLTYLPDSLGNLSSLLWLYVSNNNLTALPNSLGRLSSLQNLYVGYNNLTALPDSLGSLSNLKMLYLDNNFLTSLPDSLGSLSSLQTLYVNNNNLTALPDSLGNLSSLKWLSVNNNNLTALPDSLGSLSSLRTLSVNNNKLTAFPISPGELPNLGVLSLAYNPLEALPEELTNRSLTIQLAMDDIIHIPDSINAMINRRQYR
jgi:Leucine-rich repeat (LRR) protein